MAAVCETPHNPEKLLLHLLQRNWRSGLTVAFVSIPLSISLAIANGGSPVMGIITAMWAGFFSATGGSQFNILGPTGALSGIVAPIAYRFGEQVLPFLAILSGFLCIVFGLLRIDKCVIYIPSAVVNGFTLGVAIIIIGSQVQFALGLDPKTLAIQQQKEFYLNFFENLRYSGSTNPWAVLVFLLVMTTLLFVGPRYPKIPWSIVAAAIGIALGVFMDMGYLPKSFKLLTLQSNYVDMNDNRRLHTKLFTLVNIERRFITTEIFVASLWVAFVSTLETLISARIAHRLTNVGFNPVQEVLGLGVANIVVGIFGGLPATAALARTALNIRTGATGRASGLISALGIMLISLTLLQTFKYLPLSVIGSILVVVGVRMVDVDELNHSYRHDKQSFLLSMLVTLVVIITEPIKGIVIGVVINALMYAYRKAKARRERTITV